MSMQNPCGAPELKISSSPLQDFKILLIFLNYFLEKVWILSCLTPHGWHLSIQNNLFYCIFVAKPSSFPTASTPTLAGIMLKFANSFISKVTVPSFRNSVSKNKEFCKVLKNLEEHLKRPKYGWKTARAKVYKRLST